MKKISVLFPSFQMAHELLCLTVLIFSIWTVQSLRLSSSLSVSPTRGGGRGTELLPVPSSPSRDLTITPELVDSPPPSDLNPPSLKGPSEKEGEGEEEEGEEEEEEEGPLRLHTETENGTVAEGLAQHGRVLKSAPSASIRWIVRDKQCDERGGFCMQTSDCFDRGGRTMEAYKGYCGEWFVFCLLLTKPKQLTIGLESAGPVARQCCFFTARTENGKRNETDPSVSALHHLGPIPHITAAETFDPKWLSGED